MTTTRDLFDAYLQTLSNRPSFRTAQDALTEAAETIGDLPVDAVKPHHVVAVLRPIFLRGAPVSADKTRQCMSAAFNWALKSANDYRIAGARNWGIDANPVAAVPRDTRCSKPGNRWLNPAEFFALLDWSRARPNREHILLLALTGQRVKEILQLRPEQWDESEGMLTWATTKTGTPHCIPVAREVADILTRRKLLGYRWLFPRVTDYSKPVPTVTTRHALYHFSDPRGIEPFNVRDLRRTWKTLAGYAGLTKEERDLYQNHARRDVSSIHYDRYLAVKEKRAAIEKWEAWVACRGITQDAV